jgi:hypothetical protein
MRILSYKSVNVKLRLDDFAGKKPRFYALAAVGRLATRFSANRCVGISRIYTPCKPLWPVLPMCRCVLRSRGWRRCQDSVGRSAAGQVRAVVTVDRILRFYGKSLT